MMLKDKTILLGVTGGIAAYKSAMPRPVPVYMLL